MATNSEDEHYNTTLDNLQKWFEENRNLPKKIDRLLLERFYLCMYKDIEDTKKLIEVNYAIRQNAPHIFINRDPTDEDSQRSYECIDMVSIPGLTPENYRLTCFRLRDLDPKKMHYTEDIKTFIMFTDCRFSMPDISDGSVKAILSQGEIQILDINGFTMKHAMRLSIATLRTYTKFLQQAFPVRMKAVHVINCPSYIDRLISVIKPFISSEVFNMMHFHTAGIETLYEHVPRELLPDELGGQAGKFADLKENFLHAMLKKRDYLIDPDHWKIES